MSKQESKIEETIRAYEEALKRGEVGKDAKYVYEEEPKAEQVREVKDQSS